MLVNANDVAVCGARPRWFLAIVLVPPGTTEAFVQGLFTDVQNALAELGATLVGGHTEVTAAVTQPVVIGQMLGHVEQGAIVTTAGFGPGDVVLQVRPTPIEGAAVLSREAADRLLALDPGVLAEARAARSAGHLARGGGTAGRRAWSEGNARSDRGGAIRGAA